MPRSLSPADFSAFPQLESTRPAFDANAGWTVTQTADPAWLPGQGAGAGGKEVGVGGKFKQIDPKKMAPLSIYKMMISAVVSGSSGSKEKSES